jgi:hypothetical protein
MIIDVTSFFANVSKNRTVGCGGEHEETVVTALRTRETAASGRPVYIYTSPDVKGQCSIGKEHDALRLLKIVRMRGVPCTRSHWCVSRQLTHRSAALRNSFPFFSSSEKEPTYSTRLMGCGVRNFFYCTNREFR